MLSEVGEVTSVHLSVHFSSDVSASTSNRIRNFRVHTNKLALKSFLWEKYSSGMRENIFWLSLALHKIYTVFSD